MVELVPLADWLTGPNGLATRLQQLRRDAGITQSKHLAERLGWTTTKASRTETGQRLPTEEEIQAWVAACGADPPVTHELLGLRREAESVRHRWQQRMRRGQAAVQAGYNTLMQTTTHVRHFQTAVFPAMLQTPDYARCVLEQMRELHGAAQDVAEAVEQRMRRQQLLYIPDRQWEFLLAEPVLRWRTCPIRVLRPQLDRILSLIGLPRVRVGVLPLDTQSTLAAIPQHSFSVYDDTVIVETFGSEIVVNGAGEVSTYIEVLDRMWGDAAEGEDARQLVSQAIRAIPET